MHRVKSFKRKKTGQTTCSECGKKYNNSCVPNSCECGHFLGGTFKPSQTVRTVSGDAKLIHNLVSVRLNKHGANLRTFVSLTENKVHYLLMFIYILTY